MKSDRKDVVSGIRAIALEISGALLDLSRGGHLVGVMIDNFTVWPLSWFIEESKERIKK